VLLEQLLDLLAGGVDAEVAYKACSLLSLLNLEGTKVFFLFNGLFCLGLSSVFDIFRYFLHH
jgi:hypothetical protein